MARTKEEKNAWQREYRERNREKAKAYSAARYQANKEIYRQAARDKQIVRDEKREEIFESLAGRPRASACEICKEHGSGASKKFKTVFDHDHATGQFRGWLCNKCNWILGLVSDDPSKLDALAEYLRNGGIGYGPSPTVVESALEEIEQSLTNERT